MINTILYCLALLLAAGPVVAAERTDGPPPAYLNHLACRIASRELSPALDIKAIADVHIDTMSVRQADRTFHARLHNGQQLTAIVQHVFVRLPRDRFNITLLLDGKPHMRLNHIDLDIFAETTVDGRPYLLHCFADLERGPMSGIAGP